jgi:phosphatidylserine decarboxylase
MSVSTSRLSSSVIRVLPRKKLSHALGRLAAIDAPQPALRRAIELFCSAYKVDLYEAEVPADGFSTFDDFFTRRLKAGARPINNHADAIVSPADGTVQALGRINPGVTLLVKGATYSLEELLGDGDQANKFENGTYIIIYLSPGDYHRVHAPIDGRVESLRHIGGTLLPVNDLGLRYFPGLFARNERLAIYQQSPRLGQVATMMVGAFGVGRMSVSFDPEVKTNQRCTPGVRLYHQT